MPSSGLVFDAFEPRVLFSAVPADAPEPTGESSPQTQEEAPAAESEPAPSPERSPLDQSIDAALSSDENNDSAQNPPSAQSLATERKEIVFISADITDPSSLIDSLPAGMEAYQITGDDGLEQIANFLQSRTQIDAIHLLTHGSAGKLYFGSTVVDETNLESEYADELATIRSAMTDTGDFLIYACDFAAGDAGQSAMALLAQLIGTEVAASTDDTGHTDLGGDWTLESQHGAIESDSLNLPSWHGLLAPISFTNTSNASTLATNIIGGGINTVTGASYAGGAGQSGTFVSGTGYAPEWLGYSSGIVLATGSTTQVLGPNSTGGSSIDAAGPDNDAALAALGGNVSRDTSILSFNFVPTGNLVTMQFTFGSEEYNEYVYSNFNDSMGVWVNGVQVAVTPDGSPVSINSVNQASTYNPTYGSQSNDPNPTNSVYDSSNPNLYINNSSGGSTYNTQMDGFTVSLSFVAPVNVGVANTIRIGISDIGDASWDSWLFIRQGSLTTTTIARSDSASTSVNTPVNIDVLANDWDAE
ncbi:MAG: DUF4347 domain-containing protein, partial [Verrucomicrobiae bacterium]|nr:DUF4347 domain-containing protein [Verrucomicrobiae bacterium]